MINLLSPIEKKKILKEYRLRLGVIVLVGVLTLEIIGFMSLVPSYAAIASSSGALSEQLAEKKMVALPGGDETQKKLDVIKKEIGLLKVMNGVKDIPPSSVMGDALKVKPEGIDVSVFAYGRSGEDVMIQIGGVARTREDLLAFQRSLKGNSHFADVRYAESFITKKTDINFQLTFKLK